MPHSAASGRSHLPRSGRPQLPPPSTVGSSSWGIAWGACSVTWARAGRAQRGARDTGRRACIFDTSPAGTPAAGRCSASTPGTPPVLQRSRERVSAPAEMASRATIVPANVESRPQSRTLPPSGTAIARESSNDDDATRPPRQEAARHNLDDHPPTSRRPEESHGRTSTIRVTNRVHRGARNAGSSSADWLGENDATPESHTRPTVDGRPAASV